MNARASTPPPRPNVMPIIGEGDVEPSDTSSRASGGGEAAGAADAE
jgi:hypothetical protein